LLKLLDKKSPIQGVPRSRHLWVASGSIGYSTFPATGITAYLETGGTLEATGHWCHPPVVGVGLNTSRQLTRGALEPELDEVKIKELSPGVAQLGGVDKAIDVGIAN
jgi:hypothetical protein